MAANRVQRAYLDLLLPYLYRDAGWTAADLRIPTPGARLEGQSPMAARAGWPIHRLYTLVGVALRTGCRRACPLCARPVHALSRDHGHSGRMVALSPQQ